MTGMPWLMALATDGLIAVPSCARMISTFAPWAIRFSTLDACVSADDLASFEMYVAPPAASAALIAGSSQRAHRSSWKLFQETPTVQLDGCAALGRGPARRHPPRFAGANDPRPQPVSHISGHVGRLGSL